MTNADYIRQMSDEALAEFMTEDFCELLCRHSSYNCTRCDLKLLNWLKQECIFKNEVSE